MPDRRDGIQSADKRSVPITFTLATLVNAPSTVYGSPKCDLVFQPERSHRAEERSLRVRVDRDRCEGNAFCVKIAPEVFQLDDDEYAVVIADPVPAGQEQLAAQAVTDCPRAALSSSDQ